MNFERTFTKATWESKIGYCRAIKAGNHIYVTGTASVDESGNIHAPGDGYSQAKRCFEIIRKALQDLGGELCNVVRTRMFVTDISLWKEFGRAHHEAFSEFPPATSMLEVRSLIDPQMLIEIEAEAIV